MAQSDFSNMLVESEPKKLFTALPVLFMTAISSSSKISKSDYGSHGPYECPVYKTSARHGVLTTTGHSSNFVLPVKLPSAMPEKYWVKRGTAMLTGLDY